MFQAPTFSFNRVDDACRVVRLLSHRATSRTPHAAEGSLGLFEGDGDLEDTGPVFTRGPGPPFGRGEPRIQLGLATTLVPIRLLLGLLLGGLVWVLSQHPLKLRPDDVPRNGLSTPVGYPSCSTHTSPENRIGGIARVTRARDGVTVAVRREPRAPGDP